MPLAAPGHEDCVIAIEDLNQRFHLAASFDRIRSDKSLPRQLFLPRAREFTISGYLFSSSARHPVGRQTRQEGSDDQFVGCYIFQLAGSPFAGIVCNQAELSPIRSRRGDGSGLFQCLQASTANISPGHSHSGGQCTRLIRDRSGLVMRPRREVFAVRVLTGSASSINYLLVLALIDDPRVMSIAHDPLVQWTIESRRGD